MKYDLALFEAEVEKGNLRKSEDEELVLYNYTDKCTYEKAWNEITTISRGIIFDKEGHLVAKPFPKFFNLGEREETFLKNLPNEPFAATEKYDGSLGIVYNYKEKWRVATRGSLNSEQAKKAEEILHKYDLSQVPAEITLLVEIIYPENKIVVNYGTEETLVLLGAYDTITEEEIPRGGPAMSLRELSSMTGLTISAFHQLGIKEMVEMQKTLPKDKEGFVVRFYGGLRVKIKGDEYMRIAKMLSTMSPLSFWESMIDGIVNKEYLQQLPEEFRKDFESIVATLERQYQEILTEIEEDAKACEGCSDKAIGLEANSPHGMFLHPRAVFAYRKSKEALNKYIMNRIRPTGNVMVDL